MKIFISHIYEEASIAKVLKEWLEHFFSERYEVFVSSDKENIQAGERWFDKISAALTDSRVMLVICSKKSLIKPWINIETGSALIKNIKVIPICHTGVSVGTLPTPISFFQALNLEDNNFSRDLINSLADTLGVKKYPPIESFDTEIKLKEALASITAVKSVSSEESLSNVNLKEQILSEKDSVLKEIAEEMDDGTTKDFIAQKLNLHHQRVLHYIEELEKSDFVRGYKETNNGPYYYFLTKEGRQFLVEKNLI